MAQKIIEVADLKKYYNGGAVHAMDGVTVDICRGDVIAVIGPSGGGKSTFLRSLNLLEVPTAGSIKVDGVEITGKRSICPVTGKRWAWCSSTLTCSHTKRCWRISPWHLSASKRCPRPKQNKKP